MSLTQYLHMIITYRVFDKFNSWHMLLPRYLQTFVSIVVSADVTIKLSKDIYKTRVLQKNRKGLLELNWTIPKLMHEKAHAGFDKYSALLSGFGVTQKIITRKQVETVLRRSKQCIRLRLWSVLSPNREIVNLELAEIIDIQEIHSFMDGLSRFIHVPMCLTDVKGNVLVNVGCLDSCTKFYSFHHEARKHCIESDINLSTKVSSGEFKMYKCKNNMWDIVAPIKVGGYHIANLYAGWFFFENEPVDYKLFLSQARQEGFNEEEYIATLEKAPRLSREAVEKDIDFLLTFAKLIEQRYISCPIIWLMSNLKTTLFKSTRF